jgi:hypothetical protein
MTLLIRDVEISVEVSDPKTSGGVTQTLDSTKEEIIKECVEQVMDLLNKKLER